MRVYVLDVQEIIRDKMLKLLSENTRIDSTEIFDNYAEFIAQQISINTSVVFVSENRYYAVDAYEVGAYGYLSSPFAKEKINKCLNS